MIEDRQDDATKDAVSEANSAPANRIFGALRRKAWTQNAAVVFWLMFAINAVNYLDRLIVVAVGPALKTDFHLLDSQIGILSSAFILVYTLAALPCGLIADRLSRTRVITFGVALWSVMSTATAFVRSFPPLFLTRALVGVGEASYYPAGSALLGAYYPLKKRARIMSGWQSGQLVGMVLAFAIVALLDTIMDPSSQPWRIAFFVTGIPGLILALFIWFVKDAPKVSVEDTEDTEDTAGAETPDAGEAMHGRDVMISWRRAQPLRRFRRDGAVGGDGVTHSHGLDRCCSPGADVHRRDARDYIPAHLRPFGEWPISPQVKHHGAGRGLIIVVGGISGILLGGVLADKLSARFAGGRVLAVSIGFGLAIPFYALTLLTTSLPIFVIAGILAVLALNLPVGPLVASLTDATPPMLRATAFAVSLALAHLLGDVWAPYLVGGVSTALHEHANLALLFVGLPCLALASIAAYFGARLYSRDVAKRTHQQV